MNTTTDTILFEQHRSRLFGLAYRMLGTPADAEDVLHDISRVVFARRV